VTSTFNSQTLIDKKISTETIFIAEEILNSFY